MASEARLPFGDAAVTLDLWVVGGFTRGFLQRVFEPTAVDGGVDPRSAKGD